MNSAVGIGKTLEEAVQDALARLGATSDQVELRKLEEGGSAGLLGTGFRPYRVRATFRPGFGPPPAAHAPPGGVHAPGAGGHPHADERTAFRGAESGMAPASRPHTSDRETGERPWERDRDRDRPSGRGERSRPSRGERGERRERFDRPERAPRRPSTPLSPEERFQVDAAFLETVRTEALWLLNRMGFDEATITVEGEGDEVFVNLVSEADDALLSGRRGETRLSIQQILSRLVNPRRGPGAHVIVDVNGYWQRRRDSLLERARALADQALETGEEVTTEPLASEERRLVHRALTADGRVLTESYGDGALKRIAIRPSEPAQ